MERRKKIKIKNVLSKRKSARWEDFRFNLSLVILSGGLLVATLLFLLVLNFPLASLDYLFARVPVMASPRTDVFRSMPRKATSQILKEDVLGYTLNIPPQLGRWVYKIGTVKSLTDDSLSNQYVRIYIPSGSASDSNNFEKQYQGILTIREFSSGEWKKLEEKCDRGDIFYCEEAGTKIAEKDDSVYAYTKAEKCSGEIASKCQYVDAIIKSFKLN